MKKIVINADFGGFSLSPLAVKRMAELQGRPCYFFLSKLSRHQYRYGPVTLEEAQSNQYFWSAFDRPDMHDILNAAKSWSDMSDEERSAHNKLYNRHQLENPGLERTDPYLIQVVEELGAKANGACASLKVVEIPDDIEYEIEEYDGAEWISEVHRRWG